LIGHQYVPRYVEYFKSNNLIVKHAIIGPKTVFALVQNKNDETLLFSWGCNKHGQMGINEVGDSKDFPHQVNFDNKVPLHVASGNKHTLYLVKDKSSDEQELFISGDASQG